MARQISAGASRKSWTNQSLGIIAVLIFAGRAAISFAAWEDHERLSRESLMAELAQAHRGSRLDLKAKNLSDLDLHGIDFHGAIGDLKRTDFTDAKMTHMKGAADMKNQSMGLMHTSMVNGQAVNADLSDSDFSRAEFSFSDFSHAKMVKTKLYRADFSGSTLVGVDLTGADLHDALLIDADLTNANLTNADLTGANLQGAKGLATAIKTGTRGLPGAI